MSALQFDHLVGAEAEAFAGRTAPLVFQRPAWTRAVAAARGKRHEFAVVRAHGGGVVQAWLPGAVHRRMGLPVFEAMPMGGYGGWVAAAALSAVEEAQLTREWLAGAAWPIVVLTGWPGRCEALPAPPTSSWLPARWTSSLQPRRFETHLLDLAGDDAAMLQRVRPRMRGYLRQFEQLGFEFSIGRDRDAMIDCHRWYQRGSREWQVAAASLMPQAFFAAMAGEDGAEAWSLRWQGRPVGAALFLVGRNEVQYQASGTERIDAPVSAMEALLWLAARHYREHGHSTLNLGASAGLDGVARFKVKFGARPVHYLRVVYTLPRWRGCAPGPALAPGSGEALP